MQVSLETGEGLERKLTVQVPADKVTSEVENRLKSLRGRVKIDGFRPGKVPLKIVKQRYEQDVFHEVAGEVMQNSFRDAVIQEKLRPAGQPMIDPKALTLGQDIEFTATFEVYPEIELNPVSDLKLEKRTSWVTDADIDTMFDTLRNQRTNWVEVDRKSENGDQVTVNFVGKVDGEAFEGGTAENVAVVLGAGRMIAGFEEQLTGLEKGADTVLKVKFPDDYQAKDLAGKDAEFETHVVKVEAPELPEINEDFAKSFGITDGSIETLRSNVRDNMTRELEQRLKSEFKSHVVDKLLEANDIDVPSATVNEEAELLSKQVAQQQGGAQLSSDLFLKDAERRVKLGILLAEVVSKAGLKVSKDMLDQRIEDMSQEYDDPAQFVSYYKGNPEMSNNLETLLLEEMVVDWIADQASVKEEAVGFEQVINPAEHK